MDGWMDKWEGGRERWTKREGGENDGQMEKEWTNIVKEMEKERASTRTQGVSNDLGGGCGEEYECISCC